MKSVKIVLALLLALGMCSFSYAQLGKLKDKATSTVTNKKDKATEKPVENTKNNSNSNVNTNSNANANAGSAATPNVSKPTVEFATDFTFNNKKTNFEPGEEIFVRLVTPKPMGEMFKEAFKMQDIPLSGAMAIAIAKDADDEDPIVITQYAFFPNRYKDDKQFAFTLQIDEDKLEKLATQLDGKVPFNSAQTLAKGDMKLLWSQAAVKFTPKNYQWTVFFFYKKANSEDIAEAGSGVFTYNVTNENKQKLVASMNFYDKAQYETIPDDGVKTDFHKNNLGKIAFAKKDVPSDGAGATNSFANLAGGIYARAFMPQSIKNWYAPKGRSNSYSQNLIMLLNVNGKEYFMEQGISTEQGDKATSIGLALAPTVDKERSGISQIFAYVVSTLPPGKHKINVRLKVQDHGLDDKDRYLLGEGTLELTITAADRDAFVKQYGSKMKGNVNTYQDKQLAALIKQQYPGIAHALFGEEIVRNAFGQILYRTIVVDIAAKNDKGEHLVTRREVKQEYIGGQWSKTLTSVMRPVWFYIPAINITP